MSKEEIGTLIIVILKARNLNDKHKFRKQDVFAKVGLNGKEEKSRVDVKGGQHPVWDDEVRFPVMKAETGKFRTLELSCWSKEPRDDDLLGKADMDISKIIQTGEFDEWVPLSIDGTVRGDLYLEMTYYSNGPAPPELVTPPPQAAPTPRPQQQQQQQQQPQQQPLPQAGRPAGNNLAGLGVPGSNLMRRPSKLSPAERLSRPAYYYQQGPPQGYQDSRPGGSSPHQAYPLQPDSRYPVHPGQQHGRQSSLPPLPEPGVQNGRPHRPSTAQAPPPNLLRPGATPNPARPYSDPSIPTSPTSPTRPGQANPYLTASQNNRPPSSLAPTPAPANPYLTSTTPAPAPYGQQASAVYQPTPPVAYTPVLQQQPPQSYTPTPQQPPPQSYTPTPQQPPPQSYTPVPPHHSQSLPPSSTPAPSGPPPFWAQGPNEGGPSVGSFSFPMPTISGPDSDAGAYPPGGWPGGPPPRVTSPYDDYASHRRVSDSRDDLAFNPRYQTPLPLPPGVKRDSSPRQSYGPPPPPKPHSPSPPPARRPHSQPRREPSPPKASSGMSSERLMALRLFEEQEKKRQEQEKRDLELAMQLDRELNLSG